jgi:hypothetical protein
MDQEVKIPNWTQDQNALLNNATVKAGNPGSPWTSTTATPAPAVVSPTPTNTAIANADPNANYNPTTGKYTVADKPTSLPVGTNQPDSSLPLAPTAPLSEADLIKQRESEAQSVIQSINKAFESKISTENQAGDVRNRQTNALNVARGLTGSPDAGAAAEKTKDVNSKAVQAIEDERSAKIAQILYDVDVQAQRDAKDLQETYKNDYESYRKATVEQAEKRKADAQAQFSALAKNGVDFEKLKNTPQYQQMLKDSGFDPGYADLFYNSQKPKAAQIEWKTQELKNGNVLFYGKDPVTGQLRQTEYNVDLPDGFTLQIADDGTPIIFNKDKGVASIASGFNQGQFAKSEKGSGQKIVNINGTDYVQNSDGSYSNPNVPEAKQQATELKTKALSSAKALLEKLQKGQGSSAVGGSRIFGGALAARIPGTDAAGFVNDYNTLKGQLSLDNVKLLKGQGAVSDSERQLLANASTRLNLAQSDKEFQDALNDIISGLSGTGENNPDNKTSTGQVIEWNGKKYQTDAEGNFDPNSPLTKEGSVSNNAQANSVINTVSTIPNGKNGGQCGHFVNQLTDLGMGDSYQSKISKMDPSIKTPQPGMIFVMPYKDNGHTGIILSVNNGIATVKDSNYGLDEKIQTHQIPVSKMTGFTYA